MSDARCIDQDIDPTGMGEYLFNYGSNGFLLGNITWINMSDTTLSNNALPRLGQGLLVEVN